MEAKSRLYPVHPLIKKGVIGHLIIASVTLVLLMMFGVIMLLNQAGTISIGADTFYQMMTAHGIGMIGISALGGAAIMWYFVTRYLDLKPQILMLNLFCSVIGVVMILVAIFRFQFSNAWTFLYPLPAQSVQYYGKTGALLFLFGVLLIGVGFLIMYMEIGRKIRKHYGSLRNGLGWDVILGRKEYGPPAAVVASTMVVIANSVSIVCGAVVLLLSIANIINPGIQPDPLLMKHLTYAFGHVFANCTIYMAVIAVYEILSKQTDRPWKANKIFLIAWNCSTIFTLMIYTHHLLMDFVVPQWMLLIGQIFSHLNGLPAMVVTTFGAMMIVFRSGIRWDMASGLMYLSMVGWVSGAIPAIVDATIVVNHVMHNTKWVPGHFHLYMGLGLMAMIIGFMYYFNKVEGGQKDSKVDRISAIMYTVFFLGLSGSFLYAGKISAARRWAVHLPEWMFSDLIGALSGIFIILATVLFVARFILNVRYTVSRKRQ